MPGVHLIISKSHRPTIIEKRLHVLLRLMMHTPEYREKKVMLNENIYIGFTGYPKYPILSFETDNFLIVFEGHSYNKKAVVLRQELLLIAERLSTLANALSVVKPWVLSADGDYVCMIIDKKGHKLWLFNDPMGRLPVYTCKRDDMLLISREVKFITGLLPEFKYDMAGIAETLILGYSLGCSTLVEDVQRLYGGVLLSIDLKSIDSKYERIYEFNFDMLLEQPKKRIVVHANELADRFLSGCYNIKETFPEHSFVVSLSGGFDSRAVLAGMKRVEASVSVFSFQDAGSATRGKDAIYAEQVAMTLGVDWRLYEASPLAIHDIENLLWIKDGMNFSQMGFLMPLFRKIRADYGPNVLHMTGDNGDRSMDPQGPPINLKNFDDFIRFTIERHARIKLEDVSAITGLTKQEIIEQIRHKLSRYPERDMNNRYKHFIMAERLFNWNFQAEDRNRTYFWHATPFSSFPYFEYAMAVPDTLKKHWKLCELFMSEINPKCLEVFYANWDAPITSYKRYLNPFMQAVYERLPAWLRIAIRDRTLYRGLTIDPFLSSYLTDLISDIDQEIDFLDTKRMLEVATRSNVNEFHNILTICTYIRLHKNKFEGMDCSSDE